MTLDPRSEQELVGGGDTLLHYHLADRATNAGLQKDARVSVFTNDFVARVEDDFLVADTSAGAIDITLPQARNGKEIVVILGSGTYALTVSPLTGDTIMGEAEMIITLAGTTIHLKAIGTDWVAI